MNQRIIKNLEILKREAELSNGRTNRFRIRAYDKAINAIKRSEKEITSGKEAQKLEGIGKKTAEKIEEIIRTGGLEQVRKIDEKRINKSETIERFKQIWGVGPMKAKKLWEMGARSIEEIREKYQESLNDKQRIGLKYYQDLNERVKRSEVTKLVNILKREIKRYSNERKLEIKIEFCGSYRRKNETCGDMDILLCIKNKEREIDYLKQLIERLKEKEILHETLGIGKTKYMGIIKTSNGRAFRIDMEIVDENEWPFALLYFTGSGNFNAKQRSIAKEKGYSLSEHGLKNSKTGEYVSGIKTEKDIFEFLDMDYLEPQERKN